MEQITVKTSTHHYNIVIGENVRFNIKDYLPKPYTSILIITDETIAPLYLADVKASLTEFRVIEAIVPSGEATKSIEYYYKLQTIAMENNLDRKSLIIALGGGVVGDLAGFVAATFMRGIDYIQVPTTILAHDSSVGGKVAINHELGKNMIGNFYPPKAVIYDVATLKSLPDHEVRSGYAEIIKEGLIANRNLVEELLATNVAEVTQRKLIEHLYAGVVVKANIVEQDEREANIRMYLNLGHTLAHALETELGYGKITHGEAVAIGMLFAIRVSEATYQNKLPYAELYEWLKQNNYPISLFDIDLQQLIKHMKLDKKSQNQTIQMVLLKEVAEPVVTEISDNQIARYLEDFKKELDEK